MSDGIEILAVIPARGGSKGIPDKNLRHVGGISLVGRAVRAALGAAHVTRVLGSTDSATIADEMRAAGAEVPFLRPAELAADDTPDAPVFRHAIEHLAAEGYQPDIVVNVRPTAPLRTAAHIDGALQVLVDAPNAASVKSVCLASEHPYKMWLMGDDVLEPVLPGMRARFGGDPDIARQRLPLVYKSNGAVDAVRVEAFLAGGHFHPGVVVPFVMDDETSVDIDVEADLVNVEALIDDLG